MNPEIFRNEIEKITNTQLKTFIEAFIATRVPSYIEEITSSSSGKYHPKYDSGKGGLVRHLKMCVLIAEELLRLNENFTANHDVVICGCFMHDMFKNGNVDCGYTTVSHDNICADELNAFFLKNVDYIGNDTKNQIRLIVESIREHMGQWGTAYVRNLYQYSSDESRIVAMCDYIASRKFFDMIDDL